MVINLDDELGEGTHWTAAFRKDGRSHYFDPFGVEPDERTIAALTVREGEQVAYNDSQIQDLESQRCGHYVKRWLELMIKTGSFYESLYKHFTQRPSEQNERFAKFGNN